MRLSGLLCACAAGAIAPLPVPTAQQLQWQENEIMALIHFNMATYHDGDLGCNASNWPSSSDPKSFAPSRLNISQWAQSMKALGVKEAVLTAKHGCGFLLWPTNTTLPDGSPYTYHVPEEMNVLQQFSEAMRAAGLGHGFYYSLTTNFYLNVDRNYVSNSSLLPKQQKVTQAQFESIALAQVTELWERFGDLSEIWFDGGYLSDMKARLAALLHAKQPRAIGYNGGGISANPARWSKTEGDVPPGGPDIWSTACGNEDWGAGAPPEECPVVNGTSTALYYPSGTDYTLQFGDRWFWQPGQALRTMDELIYAYHQTVGANTVLELDFAVDREGRLEDSHVALYQRFGDWLRSCYGKPLGEGVSSGGSGSSATVEFPLGGGAIFDRIVLREDQSQGQRVRAWTVEWTADAAPSEQHDREHVYAPARRWASFASGRSIGNKRIAIAPGAMSHTATAVRVNVTSTYADQPVSVTLQVYAPCGTGTPSAITKLGTEDIGMTETTPIVFNGSLYRFESVRAGNWNNSLPGHPPYLRLRRQSGPPEWRTGEEGRDVAVFEAGDISLTAPWQQGTAITLPLSYTAFNTAVARGVLPSSTDDVFAMAIEVRSPWPGGFNLVFATAPAIVGPYTLQVDGSSHAPSASDMALGPGSCPALRFDAKSGYWHMLYTPNPTVRGGGYRTWQVYAARSRSLRYGSWEPSPLNPVLEADAFDRTVHNQAIDPAVQGWAANTTNLNDSDPFVLNWGDQRTTPTNSLAQAVFKGTLEEFWAYLYPEFSARSILRPLAV